MRRFFLLLIIWMLPLQPLFAADASFMHLLGKQSTQEKTIMHMTEHLEQIAHHHHADGDAHEDNSDRSKSHLVDFEHGCHSLTLPAAKATLKLSMHAYLTPSFHSLAYLGPYTSPPIKPPYLVL